MPPGKYVEHPLIKADDFSHVSPQHIQFLEAQGCFEIPESPALEEFIRRYFIYVHPQLPMIDEAAAWASLQRHNSDHDLDNPISIFTFQAMLFVSCSVCLHGLYILLSIFSAEMTFHIVPTPNCASQCWVSVYSRSAENLISTSKG